MLSTHATDVTTSSETRFKYATSLVAPGRWAEVRLWAEHVLPKTPRMPRCLRPPKTAAATTLGMLLLIALAATPLRAQSPASQPVWAKPDLFWYRIPVDGGNLWVKVDAQHGVKEPLFDHQRLAVELTIRTGIEYGPLTLPFADPAAQFVVKYDGSNAYIQEGAMAVEFVHGGQHWRCDLQIKWDWNRVPPTDYECLPRRPAAPTLQPTDAGPSAARSVRSPDGRWEAFVDNDNVSIRPSGGGDPRVLSTDGTAAAAYQAGSVRWSSDSGTVSAYRVSEEVWKSPAVNGNVKKLVSRGEWRVLR